ncbi:kinase-regulated stress-responsive transcription factor skn7 [Basidiobolus ranarum]|uniref:Kinase-regulated stress-responsive transcription factor skn7 n=1 Tax=Basidiobolus ranarum TaxID=34480 RepID=A0ABR2WW86_9FUNG
MDDDSSTDSLHDASSQAISLFVSKLYRILESGKYVRFIRWSATGDCFVIQDSGLFATVVLPIYFKTSIFTSFVRQLNKYDFRRISDARRGKASTNHSTSAFAHPNFRQNRPDLLHLITRQIVKPLVSETTINPPNILFSDTVAETPCLETSVEDLSSDNCSLNDYTEEPTTENRLIPQHEFFETSKSQCDFQTRHPEKCQNCEKLTLERGLLEEIAWQLQNTALAKTRNSTVRFIPNLGPDTFSTSRTKFQNSEFLNAHPAILPSCDSSRWPPVTSLLSTESTQVLPSQISAPLQFEDSELSRSSSYLFSGTPLQTSLSDYPQVPPNTSETSPETFYNWWAPTNIDS